MICTKLRSSIRPISHSEKTDFARPLSQALLRCHNGLGVSCVLFRTVKMKTADGMLHVKLILKSKGYRRGATNEEQIVRNSSRVHGPH